MKNYVVNIIQKNARGDILESTSEMVSASNPEYLMKHTLYLEARQFMLKRKGEWVEISIGEVVNPIKFNGHPQSPDIKKYEEILQRAKKDEKEYRKKKKDFKL